MRLSQAGKAPAEADLVFQEDAQSCDAFARLADSEEDADDLDRKFQKHEISYSGLEEAVLGTKSLEAALQGISKSEYQNPELFRFPNAKKI